MRNRFVPWRGTMAVALIAGMAIAAAATAPHWSSLAYAQTGQKTILGETDKGEPVLSFEDIIAVVKAAGFGKVDSIEREHGLYEVKTRDKRGQRLEVFVVPATGALQIDPDTGKPRTHKILGSEPPGKAIPVEDIVAMVEAEGFRDVYAVEYEHALYEVKTIDPGGRKVELFVNPNDGKLVRHPKTGKPIVEILE